MFPSGPAVIPNGYAPVGKRSGSTVPSSLIDPTWLLSFSVNHMRSPLGSAKIPAIPYSPGTGYSVIVPVGVIFPMLRPASSVNQTFPSGPGLMSQGRAPSVGTGYSTILGGFPGVSRTILLPSSSVNQTLPPRPVVMFVGRLPSPTGNSSTSPDG